MCLMCARCVLGVLGVCLICARCARCVLGAKKTKHSKILRIDACNAVFLLLFCCLCSVCAVFLLLFCCLCSVCAVFCCFLVLRNKNKNIFFLGDFYIAITSKNRAHRAHRAQPLTKVRLRRLQHGFFSYLLCSVFLAPSTDLCLVCAWSVLDLCLILPIVHTVRPMVTHHSNKSSKPVLVLSSGSISFDNQAAIRASLIFTYSGSSSQPI